MRDAFGGEFTMKLLLVFLFIYVAFAAVSYNYAKAFRVKNTLIDFIEENQVTDLGDFFKNKENVITLKNKLINSGYDVECVNNTSDGTLTESMGRVTSFSFCGVTINEKETSESNKQIHYEIVTQAYWNLGALNKLLALSGKSENSESQIRGSFVIKGEAAVVANTNAITALTPTLIELTRANDIDTNAMIVEYKAKFGKKGIKLNNTTPYVRITNESGKAVSSSIAKLLPGSVIVGESFVTFKVSFANNVKGRYIVTFGENSVKWEKGDTLLYSSAASIDTEIEKFVINKITRVNRQSQCRNSTQALKNNELLMSLNGVYSLTFSNNTALETNDIIFQTCSSRSSCVNDDGNADIKIIKYSVDNESNSAFNIIVSYEKRYVDFNEKKYSVSKNLATSLNNHKDDRYNDEWIIKELVKLKEITIPYVNTNEFIKIYNAEIIVNEEYILDKNIVKKSSYCLEYDCAKKALEKQQKDKIKEAEKKGIEIEPEEIKDADINAYIKSQQTQYKQAINNAINKINTLKTTLKNTKIPNIKKYNDEVNKQYIPAGFKIKIGNQEIYQSTSDLGICYAYDTLYQFK